MARIHGRKGALYVGLSGASSAAEPVAFISKFGIDFATAKSDVTAMQDNNTVSVSGLPKADGSFSGWYDDATVQTYTAAVDGAARRFYLYPSTATPGQYFFGTGLFDFSVTSGVDEGVAISGNFEAASGVAKVG